MQFAIYIYIYIFNSSDNMRKKKDNVMNIIIFGVEFESFIRACLDVKNDKSE